MGLANASPETNQASYKETPYSDEAWEIVGEAPKAEEFLPMEVGVLHVAHKSADKMFADFGGTIGEAATVRWHLPENLAWKSSEEKAQQERESVENANRRLLTLEEIEQIRIEAHEAGRMQGVEEAVGQQVERMAQLEGSIVAVITDLKKQLEERISSTEKEAVSLAIDISKKIVDGAVDINPEYILKIVREALKLSGGASISKVRVSPQDMEFIEVIGVGKSLKEYDGTWTFEADATIRAGCVVESSAGEVDFKLDTAWERVREEVIKVIK